MVSVSYRIVSYGYCDAFAASCDISSGRVVDLDVTTQYSSIAVLNFRDSGGHRHPRMNRWVYEGDDNSLYCLSLLHSFS